MTSRFIHVVPNSGISFLKLNNIPIYYNDGGGLVSKLCPTLATPWMVAHQAPLSMGFSRQEYWSRLPFPSPGDLPDPGIEPRSPVLQADSLPTELWEKPYYNDNTSYIHSCVYIVHMHTYIVMYITIYIVTISLFSDRHGFSHVDYWNNASI